MERSPAGVRLRVAGDLDVSNVSGFVDVLASTPGPIEVDLSECTFLDSSGVAALATGSVRRRQGIQIVGVSRPALLALESSGVAESYFGLTTSAPTSVGD